MALVQNIAAGQHIKTSEGPLVFYDPDGLQDRA